MRVRSLIPLSVALLAGATPVLTAGPSQAQSTAKPIASYWMDIETNNALMGGGRSLELSLYSNGSNPAPAASHTVPAGMKIGPVLPLVTPQRAPSPPRNDTADSIPELPRKPGRMLFFWGCREQAGPGQPIVVDFDSIMAGRTPASLLKLKVNPSIRPSSGRTIGEWPGSDATSQTPIPKDASIVGDQLVAGNYSPEMRFNLGKDFMGSMQLSTAGLPSGAANATWPAVSGAIGYALNTFGVNAQGDLVYWTYSEVPNWGGLSGFLPDAEVARLIKAKAVLPTSTTSCIVPVQAITGLEGAVLSGNAFGGELNFSFPPKPAKAPKTWKPD